MSLLAAARALQERLLQRGERLAVAESCTGGLLAEVLTRVPGSSRVFWGGWVVYDNDAKTRLLGVSPALLVKQGAVSKPCAEAMAEGVLGRAPVDWAVAITGVAGPSGGTAKKPVGLVYLAVAGPRGPRVVKKNFSGKRGEIRVQAVLAALKLLQFELS